MMAPREIRQPALNEPIREIEPEAIERLRNEKLELLLDEYEIEPWAENPWRDLCYRLACDHVPGMMLRSKAGRPRLWQGARGQILFRMVNDLKAERKRGLRDAIRSTKKGLPRLFGAYSERELETRYYELRKKNASGKS